MARVLQLRRGTTAENNLFTGAVAEATYDTDRKELRIHDGSTVGGKVVSAPTGAVMAFAGSSAPEGWLVCDGSAVSRTTSWTVSAPLPKAMASISREQPKMVTGIRATGTIIKVIM